MTGWLMNKVDVSCLADYPDAAVQSRLETEDYLSPLCHQRELYRESDELALLLLPLTMRQTLYNGFSKANAPIVIKMSILHTYICRTDS